LENRKRSHFIGSHVGGSQNVSEIPDNKKTLGAKFLIAVGVATLTLLNGGSNYAIAPNSETTEYSVMGGNAFLTRSLPSFPYKISVLGDLVGNDFNPLIDCLIKHESNGNEYAVGDGGKAYGILQFHRRTFDAFSAKYGLTLNYYDADDQILLAQKMLEENPKNLNHWTTKKYCITN
jgi:hypothetical protein